jgi:hypothetical protein
MAIDRFSRETFEAALPKHKETGETLCTPAGVVDGEYTYCMKVRELGEHIIFINIRSSVRPDGVAADTGEDSIRCWLTDEDNKPVGSKVKSHVSRVNGWEGRMLAVLRELVIRARTIQLCPTCQKLMGIYKVKKDGKNKGRLFTKCFDHNHFTWLDEDGKLVVKPTKVVEQLAPKDENVIKESLIELTTKKAKREVLKAALEDGPSTAVWGLLRIFEMQTQDEQACNCTTYDNGVGFTGVDAEILTSFAKQFIQRGTLSKKQLALLQKKMGKYAKQLLTLINLN